MVTVTNSVSQKTLTIWSLLILSFLYIPVLVLVAYGFNAGAFALRWEGFSLRWYLAAITNQSLLFALLTSLFVATVSSIFAVILAFFYALWAHRSNAKRVINGGDALLSLPLFIPEIVIAIGLLIFLLRFLKPTFYSLNIELNSIDFLIVGHTTLALGYAALILRGRFKTYEIQQELAAKDLGANGWNVFQFILLPHLKPAIAAACCISFAVSLDDFYVSYFLSTGGSSLQTLPLYIWSLQGRRAMTPEINVVSSLLLFIALVFFGIGLFLGRPQAKSNLGAKG